MRYHLFCIVYLPVLGLLGSTEGHLGRFMKRRPHKTIAQNGNYGKLPPSSRSADFRRSVGVNAGAVLRGTHEDDAGNPSSKSYAPVR